VVAVVTSPLLRARTTAEAIAAHHSLEVVVDPRLTEWRLSSRWAGHVWEQLEEAFPGELTAYLEHPTELDFSPEPISTVAARMAEAVGAALVGAAGGEVVVVSHQDPVQAARLALTGRNLTELNEDKPAHAELVTLHRAVEEGAWVEQARWRPEQGQTFPPRR
jgi:broad specificity phosphatase PhoE